MSDNCETTLAVEGMSCPSCIRHIDAALTDVEGVAKVEVKLREGRVQVSHDRFSAPVKALIEALNQAGYPSKAVAL